MPAARRRPRSAVAAAACALLAAAAVPAAATPVEPAAAPLVDLDGRPVDPLADDTAATVFLFVHTDCPIANRYAPELRRIGELFADRGVAFYLVYPDPGEPPTAIRRSGEELGHPFPALRDPAHGLVARTGASVTPEVAVFDGEDRMVYRGRIDDRWAGLGRPRAAPTRRDLVEVLDAIVAGERLEPRTTKAVGCFLTAPE